MFASKPGVPKKRLRLHVADQPEPFQFSFTSTPAIADAELEKFKSLLAAVVSANTSGPSTTTPTPKPAGSPAPPASSPAAAVPSPYARPSPAPYSRSPSAGPSRGGGRYNSDVYQRVLIKNSELADLHRVLVESGQITENEFWEGREVRSLLCSVCFPLLTYCKGSLRLRSFSGRTAEGQVSRDCRPAPEDRRERPDSSDSYSATTGRHL